MSESATAILGGLIGAASTVGLQQLVVFLRKPDVTVDFQSTGSDKPYLHNLELGQQIPLKRNSPQGPFANWGLWMNLNVANSGRVPARGCIARINLQKEQAEQPVWGWTLPWQRTNRITTVENYVTIYRSDFEPLAFLLLPHTDSDLSKCDVADRIYVASIPPAQLDPHTDYAIEVRISGDNLPVKKFEFSINWDGTLSGFKGCVKLNPKANS
jgi:hypothetical protein